MNASRREFLGLGSAVLGGAALAPHGLFAEEAEPAPDAGAAVSEGGGDLKVRFLGTGVGKPVKPFTAIIMEATAGIGQRDNAGLFFSHSSVDTVARTARALLKTGRYRPPAGRNVYITHLWRDQYPAQAEIDAKLPEPLKAAYDGLEVVF